MQKRCLPSERRNCGHCHEENSLDYYHELGSEDLYYCNKCYMVTRWDGKNKMLSDIEAYPNRDK